MKDFGKKIDYVLNINVDLGLLLKCFIGCRICKECGVIYYLEFNLLVKVDVCDKCGGELY